MEQIVCGWRRSSWNEEFSRLVYFAADCNHVKRSAELHHSRLKIIKSGGELGKLCKRAQAVSDVRVEAASNDTFTVSLGKFTREDEKRIEKL